MALYSYICKKCKSEYEEFSKDGVDSCCPECGGSGERQISLTNFVIKGTKTQPWGPAKIVEKKVKEVRKKVFSDWFCPKCDYVEMDEFRYPDDKYVCSECGEVMRQMVSGMHFKLTYDPKKDLMDWSGNRSQYYNAVNEARCKGEDVKAAYEVD